jgi:hypothetical protein
VRQYLQPLLRHSSPSAAGYASFEEDVGSEPAASRGELLHDSVLEGEKLVMYTCTDGHLLRTLTDQDYLRRFFGASTATSVSTGSSAFASASRSAAQYCADMCMVPMSTFTTWRQAVRVSLQALLFIRPSLVLILG